MTEKPSLGPAYWWSDSVSGRAVLYLRYGFIASVEPDGTTLIRANHKEFQHKAASKAQAIRFVERKIASMDSPEAWAHRRWRERWMPKRPVG